MAIARTTTLALASFAQQLIFAGLSAWFLIAAVASIHFHEQVAPAWGQASDYISLKSSEAARLLSRIPLANRL